MKKHIPLALVAGLTLTISSCGAATVSESPEPSSSTYSPAIAETSSPTIDITALEGMTVKEASAALEVDDVSFELELEYPTGLTTNNEEFPKSAIDEFTVRTANTVSMADGSENVMIFASPSPDLIGKHFPWEFSCGAARYSADNDDETFYSLESIWKSTNFGTFEECSAEFLGEKWEPTQKESEVEALAQEHWEGREEPVLAFAAALEYCTVPAEPSLDPSVDDWASPMAQTIIQGSVKLCPEAPFIADMKAWANGAKFNYGTYVVGEDIQAGTYKSTPKISDCYWERMNPNGIRISNDFITHASAGAIVTVRTGETFVAKKECGIWTLQK